MAQPSCPFGSKWAILIGPKDYRHVSPLKYSTDDIVEVGRALRKILEFKDDHILEFGTGLRLQPSHDDFYHEIGEFLTGGQINEDDLLVFYFSGHGFRDKKDYLLPVGASPRNLKVTGIEFENLVEQLTNTGCKNIAMFIDACREEIPGAKGVSSLGEESSEIVKEAGVASIFSCRPGDLSFEIDKLKHGVFTYCVLEAIKTGKHTTMAEVYEYLLKRVPLINTDHNLPPQKPYAVMVPDEKRNLPIFLSGVQFLHTQRQLHLLKEKLGDLYPEWPPQLIKFFDVAVEFLDLITDTQATGTEAQKLELIERLCAEKLKPAAFAVAWDGIERRRGLGAGTPKTQVDLEPLQ